MNLIRVKVIAGAKREAITEIKPFILHISTREPAQDNRANKAVLSAVSAYYQIPLHKLRILSGHQKPTKIIRVLE